MEKGRGDLFKAGYLPRVRAFPEVRALLRADPGRRLRDRPGLLGQGGGTAAATSEIAGIDGLDRRRPPRRTTPSGRSPTPTSSRRRWRSCRGIGRSEAIVVGDTPYDAEAAGKAGLRPIGVLCGGFPEAELRAAGCVAIYRDPADLLAEYETSPLGGKKLPG